MMFGRRITGDRITVRMIRSFSRTCSVAVFGCCTDRILWASRLMGRYSGPTTIIPMANFARVSISWANTVLSRRSGMLRGLRTTGQCSHSKRRGARAARRCFIISKRGGLDTENFLKGKWVRASIGWVQESWPRVLKEAWSEVGFAGQSADQRATDGSQIR